jgi:hypothetical protein
MVTSSEKLNFEMSMSAIAVNLEGMNDPERLFGSYNEFGRSAMGFRSTQARASYVSAEVWDDMRPWTIRMCWRFYRRYNADVKVSAPAGL